MPKLDKKNAGAVAQTEAAHGGAFEPLPNGKYLARLVGVDARDENNKYGAVQWSAEFDNIHSLDGEKQPGRQWLNLTLPTSDDAPGNYAKTADKWVTYQNLLRGRLAAFFEAFGYTPDSDTDEMLGEWAIIKLSTRTIQEGTRTGDRVNQVDDIEPVPDDFEAPEVEADKDDF